MCGRFSLIAAPQDIADHFELEHEPSLAPRYNIAPSQDVATVFVPEARAARQLTLRRWGLIPHWADDARIGNRQINARVETVADKPAFRQAFRRRRCIVVADGFYEWSGPSRSKQPHHVALANRALFGFAGLWESWRDSAGDAVESCTVLTTAANPSLQPLHDRMPIVLEPAAYDAWLNPEARNPAALLEVLSSTRCDALRFYPVSYRVNDVACDDASCLEVIESQPTLF